MRRRAENWGLRGGMGQKEERLIGYISKKISPREQGGNPFVESRRQTGV